MDPRNARRALDINVSRNFLGIFSVVSAVGALGAALIVLAISIGAAQEYANTLKIIGNSDVRSAAGLCCCAVTLMLFLLERPRLAGLAAAIILGLGTVTAIDRTAAFDASSLLAYGGRDMAGPQLVFGAVCLLLGLAARGIPRDIGIALLLGLSIALAAEALVVILHVAFPGTSGAVAAAGAMPGAIGLLLVASGLSAYAVRRDLELMARPILCVPILLALAITMADLLAPRAGGLRCGYALVVASGTFFPQRAVTRLFTRISIGLLVFGFAVAWRGTAATVSDVMLFGVALGAIVLSDALVRRLLRAEEAGRQRARQIDALLELAHVGCIDLDLASLTVTQRPRAEAIRGVAADAPLAWADFVATHIAPDRQAAVAASLSAARAGKPCAAPAAQSQRSDGDGGETELVWLPMRDDRGEVTGLTGLFRDSAQAMRCDHHDVPARLRNAQKMESLALLSGGIAHDLNNTLVPVSILAPLLFDSITDPADRRSVELILDAAQRARDLARDMLAYARDDQPAFETIQLAELVRGALPLLRARIPAHVTIRDAIAPVTDMTGNQRQLYQVLLNLTVNAAEAIGARAGIITIGTLCGAPTDTDAASVGLFVADDGAGMDPGLVERAFEPFFSTKHRDEATGIGLSIVRRIVQLHGGSIAVDSVPGGGTRFDLVFPAVITPESGPDTAEARTYAETTLHRR